MAKTQLVWGSAGSETFGTPIPVMNAPDAVSETIVPALYNQISANAAAGSQRSICRVSTDTAIYVKFGSMPGLNAATDAGGRLLIPAGWSEMFEVNPGAVAAIVQAV